MIPSEYAYYACTHPPCSQFQKNIRVRDLFVEEEADYGHRIIPVCRVCLYDLKLLGRSPGG